MNVNSAESSVAPVLQFTAFTSIPIGASLTLFMPAGYFTGQVSSSLFSFTGMTAVSNAVSPSSTQIALTIGGSALPASVAIVVTLSGLSLGAAQAWTPSGFRLSSSADPSLSNGLDAPAIVSSPANALPPSPSQSDFSLSYSQNAMHLSFKTMHMCSYQSVTRNCLLKNSSFPSG